MTTPKTTTYATSYLSPTTTHSVPFISYLSSIFRLCSPCSSSKTNRNFTICPEREIFFVKFIKVFLSPYPNSFSMVYQNVHIPDFTKPQLFKGFKLRFFTTDIVTLELCFMRGLRTIKIVPEDYYTIGASDFVLYCGPGINNLPVRWRLITFPGRLYTGLISTLSAQLLLKSVLDLSLSGQYYSLYGMPPVHGDPVTFF